MTDIIEGGGKSPHAGLRLCVPRPEHRKRWTDEEDERLKHLILSGQFVGEIAIAMGRTREGVRNRAATLRLTLSSGPRIARRM